MALGRGRRRPEQDCRFGSCLNDVIVGDVIAIKTAVIELKSEGYDVAHVHMRHMNPFPKNLGELLHGYDKILVPEMNTGQLLQLIRGKYLLPAVGLNKVQGQPFTTEEVKAKIVELYNQK